MSDEQTQGAGMTRLSFIRPRPERWRGWPRSECRVPPPCPGRRLASPPIPPEPVIAYVRDAERGEVTVIAGTSETTYRDRALARRLLKAAPSTAKGGGNDVLAP